MNTKRKDHACFVDEATSSIYVVGGYDDHGNRLNSTEMWTSGQNSWQPSANFPDAISGSSAVSSSNGNKFVGYMAGVWAGRAYYSEDIFGLRRRDMTWIKLNKTMKTGRYAYSLLNIPAKQVLGC